jgi:hypothetical protein
MPSNHYIILLYITFKHMLVTTNKNNTIVGKLNVKKTKKE